MSYGGNPARSPEDLWLDDLKAILNEDPNYTPAAGKPTGSNGGFQARQGSAPSQSRGTGPAGAQYPGGYGAGDPQAAYGSPNGAGNPYGYNQTSYGAQAGVQNPYAAAARKLYGQQPYPQNGYGQPAYPQQGYSRQPYPQNGYPRQPYPPMQQAYPPIQPQPKVKVPRKKHPMVGIVFLTILVMLESAGIAAVVISWIQWMH